MASNTPGQQLNDLLVTRNFDPEALSAKTGKPPLDDQGAPDPEAADMFTFDWVADSGKNYGTVVCLLGADNNFEVYFGDNLGRGMEFDDKANWYQFLDQLRNFAKRNLLRYDLQNLRRLKYTMAGMAAIKEGLFEGYYGNRKVSYAGKPTEARLMIKHDRTLGENDARFRYVESLFIETAEGERFRLPFRKLAGGRAMLEHVRHGGTPYDARGQHIVEMVEQINVLSQFRRAHQGRVFEGAAGELVAETTEYLNRLRHNLKAVSHDRGYTQYFESWSPATVSESDLIVEDLKSLFVETRIDPRIEQALPMLARIQKEALAMKEAEIFESWANRIVEGTWALPETPEQQDELKMLMSQPLPVGADGMNATEQLYGLVGDDVLFDIIGDIAEENPDANCWDDERVQNRLEELGVYMVTPAEPAAATETPPVAEGSLEEVDRRGFLKGLGMAAAGAAGLGAANTALAGGSDSDSEEKITKAYKLLSKGMSVEQVGKLMGAKGPNHGKSNTMVVDNTGWTEINNANQLLQKQRQQSTGLREQGMAEGRLTNFDNLSDAELIRLAHRGYINGNLEYNHDGHLVNRDEIIRLLKATDDAGEESYDDFMEQGVAEGDNMSTFEQAQCNQTMEGEYCPEHGLEECGTYEGTDQQKSDDKAFKPNIPGALMGAGTGALIGGPVGMAAGATLGALAEDNEIVRNARKLNDGWKGTLAGSAAGGIAGDMAGQALGPAAGAALGGAIGGVPGAIAGGAMGALAGGPVGGAIGGLAGGKIGDKLGGNEETDEDSSTGAVVKGAMKAATQGLGDLVSGSGKEIAKNLIHMESNSDSALLARIKTLALLK